MGGGEALGIHVLFALLKFLFFVFPFKLFVSVVSNFVAYPLFISLNYIMLGDDRYRYCMWGAVTQFMVILLLYNT